MTSPDYLLIVDSEKAGAGLPPRITLPENGLEELLTNLKADLPADTILLRVDEQEVGAPKSPSSN